MDKNDRAFSAYKKQIDGGKRLEIQKQLSILQANLRKIEKDIDADNAMDSLLVDWLCKHGFKAVASSIIPPVVRDMKQQIELLVDLVVLGNKPELEKLGSLLYSLVSLLPGFGLPVAILSEFKGVHSTIVSAQQRQMDLNGSLKDTKEAIRQINVELAVLGQKGVLMNLSG